MKSLECQPLITLQQNKLIITDKLLISKVPHFNFKQSKDRQSRFNKLNNQRHKFQIYIPYIHTLQQENDKGQTKNEKGPKTKDFRSRQS